MKRDRIWRKVFIFLKYFLSQDFAILVVFGMARASPGLNTNYFSESYLISTNL